MTSYIYNMVDTWASGGGPYTSIKMNATDNDTGSASLLMDLQVGGASKFKVDKDGYNTQLNAGSSATVPVARIGGFGNNFALNLFQNGGVLLNWRVGTTTHMNFPVGAFGIDVPELGFHESFSSGRSITLRRKATANLQLGAADAATPVAQTLSVQSVVAGTTNTAGTALTITGSQGTGTGAGGSIIFQVAPAGSSGSAQNALQNALLIDGDGQATFTIKNTSGTPTLQIAKSGSSSIQITTAAGFTVGSSGSSLTLSANGGNSPIYTVGSYLNIGTVANNDVRLYRDDSNTLALRNGTAAQAFNLYGTYTGTGDYRRVALAMTTAGVATLKPEGLGTGASGNVLHISGLPTSNPGPGILWNDAGTPAIGT